MTKTIVIATQKGGAGKTTLATNLAGTLPGKVALLDIDPQRTAADVWGQARRANDLDLPDTFGADYGQLKALVAEAERLSFDWVVVDTIPASDAAITEAARLADLIVLPCKPNAGDIFALASTARLIARFHVPKFVIFNEVTWSGRWIGKLEKPKAAAHSIGVAVAPTYLGSRRCFPDALEYGLTVPEYAKRDKGAAEVFAVRDYVLGQAA